MQTVKVRLRKPTRVFQFLCAEIPLNRDDTCIVRSDRGLEFGTCILPPEPCASDTESRVKMNVLRKTTQHDENNFAQILVEEKKARDMCARKIRDRNLPMKLVDVEYTFDKHKVIFYFSAAERVDFRELVRDLAHELKARIELRHIQVRDEAKLVGGVGVCGRELCCSTWLREFMPISMKMAKRQNLALNPSKISGQCGRLLCCLSYESELYRERKAQAARPLPEDEPYADEDLAALMDEGSELAEPERSPDAAFRWSTRTSEADNDSASIGEPEVSSSASVEMAPEEEEAGEEETGVTEADGVGEEETPTPRVATTSSPGPGQAPHDSGRRRRRRRRRRHRGGGSQPSGGGPKTS
ncbi:MAG: stage 0 sporulation family protein [Candidatus Hydrogenedentes bacterium]|nr:stage 0 sporulation family protein [Candidatus Hydrogenedentota bacterium]